MRRKCKGTIPLGVMCETLKWISIENNFCDPPDRETFAPQFMTLPLMKLLAGTEPCRVSPPNYWQSQDVATRTKQGRAKNQKRRTVTIGRISVGGALVRVLFVVIGSDL